MHVYQLFYDDGFEEELDLSDEDKCNWMMFVRPARTAAEQNVVVCQLQNKIYFVSTKVSDYMYLQRQIQHMRTGRAPPSLKKKLGLCAQDTITVVNM